MRNERTEEVQKIEPKQEVLLEKYIYQEENKELTQLREKNKKVFKQIQDIQDKRKQEEISANIINRPLDLKPGIEDYPNSSPENNYTNRESKGLVGHISDESSCMLL